MATVRPRSRSIWSILFSGLLAILVLVALAIVAWFLIDRFAEDEEIGIAERGVTVGTITENPREWYGEDVIVSGQVNRILSTVAYTIGSERFAGGELLVIGTPPQVTTDRPVEQALVEGDIAQIAGEVRPFNRAEIEQDIQQALDPQLFQEFEGQPVLVAQSTDITPLVTIPADEVEVGEILAEPDEYVGETVKVVGDVTSVVTDRVFVVEDGLPVIDATGVLTREALEETPTIGVTGLVQRFDIAQVESELNVDLDDAALSQFAGQPVLIAQSVQIVPAD